MKSIIFAFVILSTQVSFASIQNELNDEAATTVANLLRTAYLKNHDKSIKQQPGPNATFYSVGNLVCAFQRDDSASCTVTPEYDPSNP